MADLSTLPNYYTVSDPADAGAAGLLANVQQYDPSAQYVYVAPQYGGGDDPKLSEPYYKLAFNPSLLPAMPGGGAGQSAYTTTYDVSSPGMAWSGPNWINTEGYKGNFINPGAIANDPIYGNWTTYKNVQPEAPSWLDYVGPALVGAFGFGIPAIAAGLTGGAIGGAAGSVSMPWWGNAGLSTVRQVGSGNINPLNLATTWAPGASALGVPSELAQGLQWGTRALNAYNAYEQSQRPRRTQLTYNPQNYGNMRQPLVESGDTSPVAEGYAFSPYYGSNGGQ